MKTNKEIYKIAQNPDLKKSRSKFTILSNQRQMHPEC